MSDTPAARAARPALQKRSQITRDRLVTALESLLDRTRFGQITVQDLASQAGVSVGTLYRRFEKKEALAYVLMDLYRERATAWASHPDNYLAIDKHDDLRGALVKIVGHIWRQIHAMPALVRGVLDLARDRPDLVSSQMEDMLAQGAGAIDTLLTAYAGDIRRDPKDAGPMVFYVLQTILNDHALNPADLGRFGPPADLDFCAEIADFVYGYLTCPPRDSGD